MNSNKKRLIIGIVVLAVLLVIVVGGVFVLKFLPLAPDISNGGLYHPSDEVIETTPTPEPTPTPKVMIPELAELHSKNSDIVGWLKIADTQLDYAVVHTPEDPQKYLYMDLEGNWSGFGSIFIEGACSLEPRSTNLLFHGHNMLNGSMFRTLMSYKDESFYKKHPIIEYSDLYENKEYEIFAVLRDRVYHTYETCFKFYNFLDPATEEEFNEGITYFKEHSLYDTGITPVYGDKLITLSTCAYHTENGRFLVVAREVTEAEATPAPVETPQAETTT